MFSVAALLGCAVVMAKKGGNGKKSMSVEDSLDLSNSKLIGEDEMQTKSKKQKEFLEFAVEKSKKYETVAQYEKAKDNFEKNMESVEKLNKKHGTAKFAANKFSDLSPEEFKASYLGLQGDESEGRMLAPGLTNDIASIDADSYIVDWSSKLTPVKDQGSCGSCWAFAATSLMEGLVAINTGAAPVRLSEQQMVDCVGDNGFGGQCDCASGCTASATLNYAAK